MLPLDDAACGVDGHGNRSEQGGDQVFHAVHGIELGLPQQTKQRQAQDAQTTIEVAAIEGDDQHAQCGFGGAGGGMGGIFTCGPGADLGTEGEQGCSGQ